MGKSDYFKEQLELFETKDIKEFTEACLADVPDYFFNVPASSSKKHHNEADCLEHGLLFHTKSGFKFLNYILRIDELIHIFNFDVRMRDMMRCAILLHDSHKSGTQEEYDQAEEKHTKFMHPIMAQKFVLQHRNLGIINQKEVSKIGQLIASHMGNWNTSEYEPGRLPVPMLPEEKIVHLADYLASREDVVVLQPECYSVTINSLRKGW